MRWKLTWTFYAKQYVLREYYMTFAMKFFIQCKLHRRWHSVDERFAKGAFQLSGNSQSRWRDWDGVWAPGALRWNNGVEQNYSGKRCGFLSFSKVYSTLYVRSSEKKASYSNFEACDCREEMITSAFLISAIGYWRCSLYMFVVCVHARISIKCTELLLYPLAIFTA